MEKLIIEIHKTRQLSNFPHFAKSLLPQRKKKMEEKSRKKEREPNKQETHQPDAFHIYACDTTYVTEECNARSAKKERIKAAVAQ